MQGKIITISRQCGSGGHSIGSELAKRLDVPFYDKEIIEMAAKESGFHQEFIEQQGEHMNGSLLFNIARHVAYTKNLFKEGFTMKEFWNTIQLIFAGVGGWLGYFLGGCDGLLYALIAFVVVDYVTGVMCAAADKKLSSEVGFKGIAKKVLIFLLVGIANILDVQVIGSGSVLRTAVIFFYISNEGVSLLENAGHLGLPIPEKLKDILAQLHDRAENGKGDE